MKEFNKPTEEIVVETKPQKKERPYFEFSETELNELVDTYRRLLRIERQKELTDLLKQTVENLERELRMRSKFKTAKS